MTTFRFVVAVMPRAGILDPQGRAVEGSLPHLHATEVHDVRVGRRIELAVEATDDAGRAMEDIREVTRTTAGDSQKQTEVAGGVVASAHALGEAIARFKVRIADDPVEAARALERLKAKRADLLRALDALVDTTPHESAEKMLEQIESIAEAS